LKKKNKKKLRKETKATLASLYAKHSGDPPLVAVGRTDGGSFTQTLNRAHRAFFNVLKKDFPGDANIWAILFNAYLTYLDEELPDQMTEHYGIEYPLDAEVVTKKGFKEAP